MDNKNLVKRIVISLLWFVPVVVVIGGVIGMFVGGFAGSNVASFHEGVVAGRNGVADFQQRYGKILFTGEAVIWFLLSFFGILPGTGKPKKE